ncbi:hypothetical protein IIU_06578 [Bacillus cereus VD133]|uniref:Uncharacterized protein n=1 Tax=Bacillus cereus VD133 TaxID=1053233 RepID=A0A9W5PK76_BACCE|nr:hypothetical protein IIU_06578 [Bacillus cereus VD133]
MQTLAILSISIVVVAGFMFLAILNYDFDSIRENPLPTVCIVVVVAILSISLYNSGKRADHNITLQYLH